MIPAVKDIIAFPRLGLCSRKIEIRNNREVSLRQASLFRASYSDKLAAS